MVRYEQNLPSFHLTLDDFQDLVCLLSDSEAQVTISVSKGGLTKSYASVSDIREDPTLPSDLRNVRLHVEGNDRNVRLWWDSTGSITTSLVNIRGDERIVQGLKDDLDRYFDNHSIWWRTVLSNEFVRIPVAVILAVLLLLLTDFVPFSTGKWILGVIAADIGLFSVIWG